MDEPTSTKRRFIEIDKNEVHRLLINKSERVTSETLRNKSKFNCFKRIILDGNETAYVTCAQCDNKSLIKYDPDGGAKGVNYHIDTHKETKTPTQTTINNYLVKSCPKVDKDKVSKAAAKMCAMDMRPFRIIEGRGMELLIQTIIDIVAIRGKISVQSLLPSADTVKSEVTKLTSNVKEYLKESLSKVSYVNATTDHWYDTNSNNDYMTITLHYFDETTFKLNARVIGTFAVDSKTSLSTESAFRSKLNEFNLLEKIRVVVTDNATSMKSAFKNNDWIGCSAHNLNLVLKWAFNNQQPKTEPDPLPSITYQIEAVKELVTYVKKSSINSTLQTKLRQSVETRWDSTYDMIQSVIDNFDTLNDHPSLTLMMDNMKKGLLREVCDILKVFKDVRVKLSAEKEPTIHAVVLSYEALIKYLNSISSSHNAILVLRSRLKKYLDMKFNITPFHVIATFLYPKFRSISYSNEKIREESFDKLNEWIEEVQESDDEENMEVPYYDNNGSFNLFDDLVEEPMPSSNQNEIEEYKRLKISTGPDSCPFKFWITNRNLFPKLSGVALWLLSAPATSCSSERNFSSAGFVVENRNRLLPETVDNLLLLKSNSDIVINM